MSEKKKLVIMNTRGLDDERASVAWSVANGGIKSGLEVYMFLTSNAVDWVRKGAADNVHLNPFDPPLKEMIDNFMNNGGTVMVCPPCMKVRGYTEDDLLGGIIVIGSAGMHEQFLQGAAALSF